MYILHLYTRKCDTYTYKQNRHTDIPWARTIRRREEQDRVLYGWRGKGFLLAGLRPSPAHCPPSPSSSSWPSSSSSTKERGGGVLCTSAGFPVFSLFHVFNICLCLFVLVTRLYRSMLLILRYCKSMLGLS